MTDAPKPVFPLAIVADGWFTLPAHGSFAAALFHKQTEPQSIGLTPYFDFVSHATYDAQTGTLLHTLNTAAKRAAQQYSFAQKVLQLQSAKHYDLDALYADKESAKQYFDKAFAAATPEIRDFAVFETTKGRIAFHVDFDTAAAIGAMAQQGRIVTLLHDDNGFSPKVTARAPTLPNLHRALSTPTGKAARPKM